MLKARKVGLLTKFNLLIIALILATSVSIGVFVVQDQQQNNYDALLKDGVSTAALAAQKSEYAVYTENQDTLQRVVEGLSTHEEIVYAAILNKEAQILLEKTLRSPVRPPLQLSYVSAPHARNVSVADFHGKTDGKTYTSIRAPIVLRILNDDDLMLETADSPHAIGYVQIVLSHQGLYERKQKFLTSLVAFTSVLALIGVAVTVSLTRRIAAPLRTLALAAHHVAEGNLDQQVKVATHDEVGELASAFNQMIERLKVSRAEVKSYQQTLETKVQQRTAELQQSTERLQRAVSEREQAEESLRESETRHRALVENMYDLVCELDAAGRYIYLSPNYLDVLGYAAEELLGGSTFDRIHPEDLSKVLAQLNNGADKIVFRVPHKNGQWRWMESTLKAHTTAQGQFRAVVVSRDITERRKTEEELSLRDRAIGSTSEGICITDPHQPDNPIVYINAGFERMTGYAPEEVLGKNCRFLQGPHTDQATLERLRAAVAEQGECVVELLNYRKDGAPFWNRLAITPVRNANGQVTHFIGVQSDITERKEMERVKDELVSTVSHELRTPLTSLRGFAELMLKRAFPPEKQREFLGIIHKESMRLTELINDFLDLQRIEAGRQTYDYEEAEIGVLLQETIAVFDLENGQHTLRFDVPASLPLVHVDTARVRQVVTNLLSNAIKFSPRGGVVTIGAALEGDAVKVWVADQGVGIPSAALPNLFHKFFRVDNRDTRSIGGTGLGLALVKEIVKAHGGRAWVESAVGVGSTFFFTLPIAEGVKASESRPLCSLEEVSTRKIVAQADSTRTGDRVIL